MKTNKIISLIALGLISCSTSYYFIEVEALTEESDVALLNNKVYPGISSRSAPFINSSVSANPNNNTAVITIVTYDASDDIDYLQLPDGTITRNFNSNGIIRNYQYTVTKPGTYTFTSYDMLGNKAVNTVTITASELGIYFPVINVTGNPTTWTNQDVLLNINVTDANEDLHYLLLPNGESVYSLPSSVIDTTYLATDYSYLLFHAFDRNNNMTEKLVEVKIDKTAPTITEAHSINANKDTVTINLTMRDNDSGIEFLILPDGATIFDFTTSGNNELYTFTTTEAGTYTFEVYDKAGNSSTRSVTITESEFSDVAPVINVTGNPTSWTNQDVALNISVTDADDDVSYILLPNGNTVSSTPSGINTTYTVSNNGYYTFSAIDHAGNMTQETVIVDKIDKTAPTATTSKSINANKDTATINLTMRDNDSGIDYLKLPDGTTTSNFTTNGSEKQFVFNTPNAGTHTFEVYDKAGNKTTRSVTIYSWELRGIAPVINVTGNPTSWTNQDATLNISGTDVNGDIDYILLPNNNKVYATSTTYTVTDNGTYTFKIFDKKGNEDTEIVVVDKIDKSTPSITETHSINANKDLATINLTMHDGKLLNQIKSDIDYLKLPDGTIVSDFETFYEDRYYTFTTTEAGTHTFEVYDKAGNKATRSVTITEEELSGIAPVIKVTGNPTSWTNQNVNLNISGTDVNNDIDYILLPNNNKVYATSTTYTVTDNGTYTFKIVDKKGNEKSQNVVVNRIDKTVPTITETHSINTNKDTATIRLTMSDTASGIDYLKLPDGTTTSNFATSGNNRYYTFTTTQAGTHTFEVYDKAGNKTTRSVTITEEELIGIAPVIYTAIDKTITGSSDYWSNKDAIINISTYDMNNDLDYIEFPDGSKTHIADDYATNNCEIAHIPNNSSICEIVDSYTVTENGSYTFKVVDKKGNETIEIVEISSIDNVAPTITETHSVNTNKDTATIRLTMSDTASGIDYLKLPNGTTTSNFTTSGNNRLYTFTTTQAGTHTFEVYDRAGNKTTRSVTIYSWELSGIAPVIKVTGNPTDWTNQNVNLNISGTDVNNDIDYILLPNNNKVYATSTTYTVTDNGTYTFKIVDKKGNEASQNVVVNRIDRTAPTLTETHGIHVNKDKAAIYLTMSDTASGIDYLKLPDGTTTSNFTASGNNRYYTFITTEAGTHTFEVYDKAGNKTTRSVTITEEELSGIAPVTDIIVDKIITGNSSYWSNRGGTINIYTYDINNDLDYIEFPDGSKTHIADDYIMNNCEVTNTPSGVCEIMDSYTVTENGSYTFKVVDKKGNETIEIVNVDWIDKVAPTVSFEDTINVNKDLATIKLTMNDSESRIHYLKLPNGTITSSFSTSGTIRYYTFTTTEAGTYTFEVYDNAGNKTTKSITITEEELSGIAPVINVTGNPTDWTKDIVILQINATDANNDIDYILLPNGNELHFQTTASYLVSSNGTYTFKVVDDKGNEDIEIVVVDKIDKTAPTITETYSINANKDTATINLTMSDDASGINYLRLHDGTNVTNFTTSGNNKLYTFTITEAGTYGFNVYDNVGNVSSGSVTITEEELSGIAPVINVTGNPTDWTNQNATLSISGTDVNGDIDYILLPNNNKVYATTTTYTVSANGTYTFKIFDEKGNETSQSVNVTKIDKTKPTGYSGQIDYGKWINVYASFNDDLNDINESNLDYVIMPDGSIVDSFDYLEDEFTSVGMIVYEPGTYVFKAYDHAGNETIFTEVVENYPNSIPPTINVTGNPTSWTKNNVTLNISGADVNNDIDYILLPDGNKIYATSTTYTVTANGTYTFKVIDEKGNEAVQSVVVNKIDKVAPTVTTNKVINANKDIATITVTMSDSLSGLDYLELPDGTITRNFTTSGSNKIYTFTTTEAGTYSFDIVDNVGNVSTRSVAITEEELSGIAPVINITGNPTSWTKENVTLSISGTDVNNDIDYILLPNNNKIYATSTTYTVTTNGTYTFKIFDEKGNETSQNVVVNRIDKVNPVISTQLSVNVSKTEATITILLNDTLSGVDYLKLPDGTIIRDFETVSNNLKYVHKTTDNGIFLFKVYDKVGNESFSSITVNQLTTNINPSEIDRIEYKLSGATTKDWTTYNEPFYITNEGVTTITARAYDNAGNVSEEVISTAKVDKTSPINNSILIELN